MSKLYKLKKLLKINDIYMKAHGIHIEEEFGEEYDEEIDFNNLKFDINKKDNLPDCTKIDRFEVKFNREDKSYRTLYWSI